MNSLWPNFEDHEIEQNNSIEILRMQAREIKKLTKGVVNATFSKIEYKSGPTAAIEQLNHIVEKMASTTYEEVLEDELSEKINVNELYRKTEYKFELFNSKFRFRLFVLNYSKMFPISMIVDEGISEDILYKNNAPIYSNDGLEEVLREVFSSSKVKNVISVMLQKAENQD
ncbi:MAG: hypothetical protein IJR97_09990 [Clostridia bacterium]|nr:hypothetical protein [Clostridia bacterium]